jgi:hypothetical protein
MPLQTKKKRCISGCKFLEREICTRSTRCKYVDGKTRKYCRLSSGYKMNASNCKVVKRIKKAEANKKIGHYFMKIINDSNQKKSEYLKAICSDSGICIAFGTNKDKITKFFGNFNNFEYVDPPIKRLGKPSNNGFVKEIKYKRYDYIAYAALKSSASASSDNLAYEYLVGQFINQQCRFFPCFLETYGLFYYKNSVSWKDMKDSVTITTNTLKNSLVKGDPTDYSKMCKKSRDAAILIQHLKDVTTIDDLFENPSRASINFVCYDLLYILYQVYMPLAFLKNNFTHYDLHKGNVLIYEPIKGKYIQYHYHIGNGETVIFKSPYIAKIIDYGRSYFKYKGNTGNLNSVDIYKKLCAEPDCDSCGKDYGFEWMEGPLSNENYFISSQIPNISHDLRLLNELKKPISTINKHVSKTSYINPVGINALQNLIQNVKYGMGIKGSDKDYGTNINKKNGFPGSINNVVDAERSLREIILENEDIYNLNESIYTPDNKIGDVHVYVDDSPMRFEPV